MITWIYGEQSSGKTTLANQLKGIHLDADLIRPAICEDLGWSDKDRIKNNLRIARLAKLLSEQGYDVVVSTILPDIGDLRERVKEITQCKFIETKNEI